jgi:hypothetical protein
MNIVEIFIALSTIHQGTYVHMYLVNIYIYIYIYLNLYGIHALWLCGLNFGSGLGDLKSQRAKPSKTN